ncbi:cytochrome P450 [Athelia psychrophila]|uniref:Cytochrome P450 n=1 Tax=Athelia psychrophila TaxID=1759441 RepID=A0A165YW69_9AGAM|nr:cytochrome P450 [Fibularhizoctonia sp. CBS 109695]
MLQFQIPSFSISHNVLLFTLYALVLYILLRAIFQLFLSPLSVIPGPWYAAVSDFWLVTHVARLQQCKTIEELFEAYGPVVRVGPNKVVFKDASSVKSVYSVHKFDKTVFYKSVQTNNNDHAMTTLEHTPHAIRKKTYAPHYASNHLALFQPEIHDFTRDLIKALDSISGKTPVDCLVLFRHFFTDVIVNSNHGYRLGAFKKWASGVEESLATAIGDFPKRGILRSVVPTWAWNLVCRIPNARWRVFCDSDKIMAEFVSARVYETRAQMNAGKIGDSEKPLLSRLLQAKYSTSESMPDLDIISEAMGHMVAGTDTTTISLSYFLWEMSRRPDIVAKLQAELDAAMPDPHAIPDITILQKLPYLNAFIKEGLRVHGAVPSLLERVVPSSTSKNGLPSESFDLMGYALPPGTVVATQAWSMHRDPAVFPSPLTFLPDRWLYATDDQLAQMQAHFMPFGTGSRICGGHALAMMMMRTTVAAIARNFEIVAAEGTDEKSMEPRDSFVMFPAAQECKLSFRPRI